MVTAAFHGFLQSSDRVDRFASWLLAGTGAVVGLVVANYGDIGSALISRNTLTLILLVFCALAVCATIQKLLAVAIDSALAAANTTVKLMPKDGTDIRDHVVLRDLTAHLRFPLTWLVRRAWAGGATDSLWSLKWLVKVQWWQGLFAFLEVLAFLGGLGILTYGVSHPVPDPAGTVPGTVSPQPPLPPPAVPAK